MRRRPGSRRQTPGKATRGRAATKGRQLTAAALVRRAFSGRAFPRTEISTAGISRTEISLGWHRPDGHSADTSLLAAPAGIYPASGPADTFRQKSDSSLCGKNRFFIRPGTIGTNLRDKGQAPRQEEGPPAPADGYSYCPDLRRSTSSRVRKRQAPRLRFFFVRPA